MSGHLEIELLAFLDNALAPAEAARVEAHLAHCETCRAELHRLQALRANLSETLKPRLARVELNAAATERIRQRLHQEQQRSQRELLNLSSLRRNIAALFEPLARRRFALAQVALIALVIIMSVSTWNATTYTARADNQETIVLGQNQFAPGAPASVRVLVRSVTTQQPIAGAEVNVTLQPSSGAPIVYSGKTDATGSVNVSLDIPDNVEGQATLSVQTRSALGQDSIVQPIRIKRTYKLFLSTDKPIYQPGQVIHMRALALSAFDQRAAAGQPVEFIVSNPNGDKVFRQTVTTSAFGIASADFQLAAQLITGKYNLQAVLGDTVSERAVEVKPYVLPKFKLTLQTDRPYYLPGAKVKGFVQADYFFGKPTAEARVELRGYTYDPDRRQTVEIFGQTDSQGRFEFSFDLPPYFAAGAIEKGRAQFSVEVAVIDQAEHREQISHALTVALNPLIIDAIPESGRLRPGVENIIYLLVSTPDGRPARATLTVNGETLSTGEYGLAVYRFTPPSSVQRSTLNVTAQDNTGASAHTVITLDAEVQPETVLLRVERAAYRVGDTLRAEALTTAHGGAIYLDVVKDSQTIATFSAPVQDGRAAFALDLAAEMFGTLELHAYRIAINGSIVRDTRLVVVDRADAINVTISADREVYRPGQNAQVSITTALQSGPPIQSALGVGIVDESVYAVQDQAPGFARLYFMLEKELLEPKVAVKGFDIPALLSPSTQASVRQAQDDAAKAAWAGVRASTFGINIRSRLQKLAELALQKNRTLVRMSSTLSKTLIALPLLMALVVIWGLRASGVLSQAMREVSKWIGLLVLVSPMLALGFAIALGLAYWICGGAVLIIALLAWLGAWLTLMLYGWRREDPRAQLAAALGMAYTLLLGLTIYVAEQGGDLSDQTALWVVLAFILMILAFVTLGQGLRLEGQRRAAWAATLVGVLWLPIVMLTAMSITTNSLFVQTIGNPLTYTGPVGWLAGCGGAAAPQPVVKEVEKKVEATQAVAMPTRIPPPTATAAPGKLAGQAAPGEPVRLRQFFPETMYWNPEALTDENGHLVLGIPLADSITTWRLTALASTQDGQIGSQTYGLRVFQDFFIDLDLPVQLTQGDEIAVPVAVYNYLTQTQQVRLELTPADWFELLDEPVKTITINANDIDVTYFRIRAAQHGVGRLIVTGRGSVMSDAIAKDVRVAPNGVEVRNTRSDYLSGDTTVAIPIPAGALAGTARIEVKLYAGPATQIVEGLDALLRMPSGCFEQTSSTLYPDLLILDYLNRTGRSAPEVRMKAEQFVATGYQRLLTYEVQGGGFSLFGNPPATLMHTAYGLMEFSDMKRVYAVDQGIISRTARWLLSQQNPDGSWGGRGTPGYMESWTTLSNDRLPTTAYITWALLEAGYAQESGTIRALSYLREHWNEAGDAYSLALVANALVAQPSADPVATSVLNKLALFATREQDAARWSSRAQSFTGASGNVADLETTALATHALLKGKQHNDLALAALRYLTRAKDSFGTWQSTQATILSLKAFLASLDFKSGEPDATVSVSLNGGPAQTVRLSPDQADVVHIVTFDENVPDGANHIRLQVSGRNTANLMYQVTASAYVPWQQAPVETTPVQISVTYDNAQLYVGDEIRARVVITLDTAHPPIQWAIVDLGVPPGFEVASEDLDALIAQSARQVTRIRRYELTGSQIILYLENLDYKISLSYRLRAKFPLRAQAPLSSVYDYYNPEVSGRQSPVSVSVSARP